MKTQPKNENVKYIVFSIFDDLEQDLIVTDNLKEAYSVFNFEKVTSLSDGFNSKRHIVEIRATDCYDEEDADYPYDIIESVTIINGKYRCYIEGENL